MKKEEIQKITEVLSASTVGPWKSFIEDRDHYSGSNFIRTGDKNYDIEFINLTAADQDFIAMARNALPLLLDEIVRLQNILESNKIIF